MGSRFLTLSAVLAVVSLSLPAAAVPHGEDHVVREQARIRRHLGEVLTELQAREVGHLDAQTRSRRAHLIDELARYREGGAFPQNTLTRTFTPIFIDESDRYCAVGHLLKVDGHDDVARAIATAQNLARVPAIDHPAVASWGKANGFTLDELTRIQPSYFYEPPYFCEDDCVASSCSLDAGVDACADMDVYTVCGDDGTMYANTCVAESCGVTDATYEACPGNTPVNPTGPCSATDLPRSTPAPAALALCGLAVVSRRRWRQPAR